MKELVIDRSIVDKTNMGIKRGVIVVMPKNSYPENLKNSGHTFQFMYNDGKTSIAEYFTVNKYEFREQYKFSLINKEVYNIDKSGMT